ncbi:MAG: sulfate reduction electron transfer complex DsrMKJOP subunit DsrJ [Candidatus Korobacteraceae bacterium]
MRDRPQILIGLLLFVGLFTYPVWHGLAKRTPPNAPAIKLPINQKQCVAPLAYMRDSHMQLLIDWREQVVRDDQRQFHAFNGKVYDKSLTRTCLEQCHTDRAEFCDRCHNYAGVSTPYCWDCHNNAPKMMARGQSLRQVPTSDLAAGRRAQ